MPTNLITLDWCRALASEGRQDEVASAVADGAQFLNPPEIIIAEISYFGADAWLDSFLERGAGLDGQSRDGISALGNCILGAGAYKPTLALFHKLLAAGANPNLFASQLRTPLQLAIDEVKPEYLLLLLMHGADPLCNGGDFPCLNALDHARNQRWAKYLLERWLRGNRLDARQLL